MCLQCFQQVMGRVYATHVCHHYSTDLHTDDRSIVVVLTPLNVKIQDQVMKCYSEVDKSYIYFQCHLFHQEG